MRLYTGSFSIGASWWLAIRDRGAAITRQGRMSVLHILRQMLSRAARVCRPGSARIPAAALAIAALYGLAGPSPAAAEAEVVAGAAPADLAAIEPGGVLALVDGRRWRLAFLRLPDPMTDLPASGWLEAGPVEPWRKAAEAAIAAAFAAGGLEGEPIAESTDRYGAVPMVIDLPAGGTLQEHLLAAGLARLDLAGLAPGAEPLQRAERSAREARLGIWAAAPYRVRHEGDVGAWLGTFQLVQARIHRAARVGGNVFVNFGPDYRSDFTVLFKDAAARRFLRSVGPLPDLAGCAVLVRGWIEYWNGPLIAAMDPDQMEFLEPCS